MSENEEALDVGEGQGASAGHARTPVSGEELERLGSLVPGAPPALSEAIRKTLLLHRTLGEDASELVLGMMQRLEQDVADARGEARRWERRVQLLQREVERLGRDNARLAAQEKPWHEHVRNIVGGGIAGLGFAGIAYGIQEGGSSGVAVGLIGLGAVALGVLLIVLPIIPAWRERRGG